MGKTSKSLRNQILLYLFISALVVSCVTEAIIIERSRRALTQTLEETAKAYATGLASLTEIDETEEVEFEFSEDIMREFGGEEPSGFFLIRRLIDSEEIERSESLEDEDLALPDSLEGIQPGDVRFWDGAIDDKNVRFIALREHARMDEDDEEDEDGEILLQPEEEENVIDENEGEEKEVLLEAEQEEDPLEEDEEEEGSSALGGEGEPPPPQENEFLFIVGLDKDFIYERLQGTITATAPALAIGLVLMLLFVWIAVNRNLKPLKALEDEVKSISVSNMSPVTVPDVTEIAAVAQTLNGMVGDLKEAFERERRFTSNVAHELRTPISEMRSLAEVALKYGIDLGEQERKNYEDILASAKEMQKTVINLLTLARCDSGYLQPKRARVELVPLIDSIWKELSETAKDKRIRTSHNLPSGLFVFTDEELLKLILQNLFCNAVVHAAEHGVIEWSASTNNGAFVFSISNSVENFSSEDLSNIFEPFWRKDEARTSGDGHSGLGLSLVKTLCDLLDFSIDARLGAPTLLTMTISGKKDHLA
jgi:two-component system sensor histidine kinase QseC